MLIPEIIRKKRDGHALSTAEIQRFVQGVTEGEVTDAQIAAFAMASIFQDISYRERTDLTLAMRDSGKVLNWDAERLGGLSWTSTPRVVSAIRCRSCWPQFWLHVAALCP